MVQKVLKANDEIAKLVRERLSKHNVRCVNMISAPGSGKTSLIESIFQVGAGDLKIGVIEGDPETTRDAERVSRYDVPVVQINTAGGCHLEAHLVLQAVEKLPLDGLNLVIIENVGNLVCPVGYDLGEDARVAVVSVSEGHDKPFKYPKLFTTAQIVVLNKIDLLPYVDFKVEEFERGVLGLNPDLKMIRTSCRTKEGIDSWINWLKSLVNNG